MGQTVRRRTKWVKQVSGRRSGSGTGPGAVAEWAVSANSPRSVSASSERCVGDCQAMLSGSCHGLRSKTKKAGAGGRGGRGGGGGEGP